MTSRRGIGDALIDMQRKWEELMLATVLLNLQVMITMKI